MEWLPHNYLKLMIQYGVKIDMTHYPGGVLIEPKKAVVKHLQEAIDGWKSGRIKWVKLMPEEVEEQNTELSALAKSGAKQAKNRTTRTSNDPKMVYVEPKAMSLSD